jgi:BirA family biotin operon repressor/biotin-[acetyl-CoA-carboxylase] ligase
MLVYTDNPQFAGRFLPSAVARGLAPARGEHPNLDPVLDGIFGERRDLFTSVDDGLPYPFLLLCEFSHGSQYDRLIDLARRGSALPDGLACLAGSGKGFHGFKGRAWATEPGNLHLVIHFGPEAEIDRFEVAFTVLAALSVTDAFTQIPGLEEEARIKWVNDILLSKAKVGGVLAYTQTQGKVVTSAILGMGVNLETRPDVPPTPFVPAVASVRDFLPKGNPNLAGFLLRHLLTALDANYRVLLEEGASPLIRRYREHSMIVGEEVTICSEDSDQPLRILAEGRVSDLGDNLELFLEGRSTPVTSGRLILGSAPGMESDKKEASSAGVRICDPAPMVVGPDGR